MPKMFWEDSDLHSSSLLNWFSLAQENLQIDTTENFEPHQMGNTCWKQPKLSVLSCSSCRKEDSHDNKIINKIIQTQIWV